MGAGGNSGATEPSSQTEAVRGCVVSESERARAEQSEQHGRRSAWRRGAERVLVPADFRSYRNGESVAAKVVERILADVGKRGDLTVPS